MNIRWRLYRLWNSEDALATLIYGLVMLATITGALRLNMLLELTITFLLLATAATFFVRLRVLKKIYQSRVWDSPGTLKIIRNVLVIMSLYLGAILATQGWTSILTVGWIPFIPILFISLRLHQLRIERDSNDLC